MTDARPASLARALFAEGLGTAFLLAVVVGSGIMGERLSGGNDALALLANTAATGAMLAVLITVFGPVSGAHLNPAVSLLAALRREIVPSRALAYAAVQIFGGAMGVVAAHLMFDEAALQVSTRLRDGHGQVWSEAVATFGLLLTIMGCARYRTEATAAMVGLYIAGAYWFTASTAFANPAVTLARALSDTFAGIAPASVGGFLSGQLAGLVAATLVGAWLFKRETIA